MNHEIDLSKYNIRTDLLIDRVDELEKNNYIVENETNDEIKINRIHVKNPQREGKYQENYITISFEDITDHQNFTKVLESFQKELQLMLSALKLKDDYRVLVVGLGNRNSTPDSLGVKACDGILVTRHLFELNEASNAYRSVATFTPNVMGNTGIEGLDILKGLTQEVSFDLIIVIDALASSKVERLNKTIQITDTGIAPGSGIGNFRQEINQTNLNIPVIAIGIPTVVDATTIVSDTLSFLVKKIGYLKKSNPKQKLKPIDRVNYLKEDLEELNTTEKNNLLGLLGSLNDEDLKDLIDEVLTPIGYNMMVTPKEIDFLIEKLALLISKGINQTLQLI